MAKFSKRKKRHTPTPSPKVPSPKAMPGVKRPRSYKAGKLEKAILKHKITAFDI
ncbi:MAG: hypothetical protein ABH852_04180 [Methanobacteriota archaeon]